MITAVTQGLHVSYAKVKRLIQKGLMIRRGRTDLFLDNSWQ